MSDYLDCLEINPQQKATASVIWLHGLGASGHDFEPVVPELGLPDDLPVRFVFPHSPQIPVTINGGMVMPAWYDILEMSVERKIDEQGIRDSCDAVGRLIQREVERGVPSERIVVAGFSQGGAVAYQAALEHPAPLAGLLTLSTYLALPPQPHSANANLPIMVCHGKADPMVPEVLGQRAVANLKELGYQPQYRTYDMEHAVCLEQIHHIGEWLRQLLA